MNFFREQEEARKRISRFRIAFYLVVFFTTIATAWFLFLVDSGQKMATYSPGMDHHADMRFLVIAGGTFLFIVGLSFFKRFQLNEGGPAIAKMAGGLAVQPDSTDPSLHKLRNVVEEMSIAAGIVPPKVYLLPTEYNINAFAAGFTSHDAVIGISKGCLERLSRDELQGVVAHEIGHIITGDMKLNLELIGYLHGLMGISNVGRRMMRSRSRSSKNKNNGVLVGLGLFLIGLLGYWLGLMLKFAISRGQEFHADAKSVQLTRNPEGIGGALKKILASEKGFKVMAPEANEISHFYFFYPTSGFLATHPPLGERIKRIIPTFRDEEFSKRERPKLEKFMTSTEDSYFIKSFSAPEPFSVDLVSEAAELFRKISSASALSDSELEKLVIAIDLNIGRLKTSSEESKKNVLEKCREIVKEDSKVSSRELICYALYKECLEERRGLPKSRTLRQKMSEAEVLFTFLSKLSNNTEMAFAKGAAVLYPGKTIVMRDKIGSSEVLNALHSLKDLRPYDKEKLFEAVDAVIHFDQNKNTDEILFLKVLRQTLDVPSVA